MSSIIKVNTFQDANGNALFSSDGSGNVTLTSNDMKATPAFHAVLTSSMTGQTSNTATKLQINNELYDTNNCYDNSTNYRFTPTVAGKYYVYGQSFMGQDGFGNATLKQSFVMIYKNGSRYGAIENAHTNNEARYLTPNIGIVIDFNGSTDYAELYGQCEVTSGTVTFLGNTNTDYTCFGAYRIIGA